MREIHQALITSTDRDVKTPRSLTYNLLARCKSLWQDLRELRHEDVIQTALTKDIQDLVSRSTSKFCHIMPLH